jgi:hypothetical protein
MGLLGGISGTPAPVITPKDQEPSAPSAPSVLEQVEKTAEAWAAKGGQKLKSAGQEVVGLYKDLTHSRPNLGPRVDNGFKIELQGGDPVATGSALNQAKQSVRTTQLGAYAGASVSTAGKMPPDFVASSTLSSLDAMPPIAGEPTAKAVYTCNASCPPKKAYEAFTKRANEMFAAAGLKLRPELKELKDGARAFIEDAGPPPVWAPVTFKLDPEKNKVTITTLDGHPLRGTNEFEFRPGEKGGTRLVQTSHFQGSSPLVEVGKASGAIDRQHGIWDAVHQFIANVK